MGTKNAKYSYTLKVAFCQCSLHILLMLAFADHYTYNHSKMHYCVNTILFMESQTPETSPQSFRRVCSAACH